MIKLASRPFIFLRHGETTANAAHIMAGFTDAPLTENGRKQAVEAGRKLPQAISYIATSTLSRAYETAALAVPHIEAERFEDLRERNWGYLEGHPIPEPVPYYEDIREGEDWDTFYTRIIKLINNIILEYENPLFVAHSGMYRALSHYLYGAANGPRIPNATPVFFEPPLDDEGAWTLRRVE